MTDIDINQVIDEIRLKRNRIIKRKLKKKAFDEYRDLRKEYMKGNIFNNEGFIRKFRSHYKLNVARLPTKQIDRYFKLMAQGQKDLSKILKALYLVMDEGERRTLQFSFSTKLIHFLDTDKPIWDSRVGKAINLKVDYKKIDIKDPRRLLKERIDRRVKIYDELQDIYPRLLRNKSVKSVMKELREDKHLEKKYFSDVKVLDSLLWGLGEIQINKDKKSC